MTHTDQSRAEFEAWARGESPSINLTREGDGYRYSLAETLYDAWHASRAAAEQSSGVELPEPVAWMLGCQTMGGDVGWKLSFSQSGAGVCHRLNGEQFEQPLHTEQTVRALLAAAPSMPQGWKLVPVEPTQEMLDHVNRTVPDLFELGDEYRAMLAAAPQPPKEQTCWCTTCRPITMQDLRFVVCPECGNKRCPRAHNHELVCTGSNAPGQPGSSWEHVKPRQQPPKEQT